MARAASSGGRIDAGSRPIAHKAAFVLADDVARFDRVPHAGQSEEHVHGVGVAVGEERRQGGEHGGDQPVVVGRVDDGFERRPDERHRRCEGGSYDRGEVVVDGGRRDQPLLVVVTQPFPVLELSLGRPCPGAQSGSHHDCQLDRPPRDQRPGWPGGRHAGVAQMPPLIYGGGPVDDGDDVEVAVGVQLAQDRRSVQVGANEGLSEDLPHRRHDGIDLSTVGHPHSATEHLPRLVPRVARRLTCHLPTHQMA